MEFGNSDQQENPKLYPQPYVFKPCFDSHQATVRHEWEGNQNRDKPEDLPISTAIAFGDKSKRI